MRPSLLGAGLGGPVPPDLWVLLGLVFATFSLQFFATTAWLPAVLRLTPAVWQRGWAWQVGSYPFVGAGTPGFWFLLELLILFLFGRDVFWRLGRRRFWRLLVGIGAAAGLVAVAAQLAAGDLAAAATPFALMQGQRVLLAILVAAFATLNAEATIYLFFVLPVPARWFLGLEILFAFLGFLGTRDLAGLCGVSAAVGLTWWWLRRGGGRRPQRFGKRLEERWLRWRLRRLQRRRGLRVVHGERDPWLH